MCKVKTPEYTPPPDPPELARSLDPDNEALYREARQRAARRGGGVRRSTLLTGLRGTTTSPVLGSQTGARPATTLG